MAALWFLWELLINIIETSLIYYLFSNNIGIRAGKKKWAIAGAVLVTIIVTLINFSPIDNRILSRIIIAISMLVYAVVAFDNKISIKIIWGIVPTVVPIIADTLTIFIANTFTSFPLAQGSVIGNEVRFFMTLIYIIISAIIYIALVQFAKKRSKGIYFSFPFTLLIVVLLIIGVFAIANMIEIIVDIEYGIDIKRIQESMLYLSVCFVVTYVITIIIFLNFGVISQKNLENELEAQNREMKETYFESIKDSVEESKGLRHDISNHLQVVKALLDEGKNIKARDYIKKLDKQYKNDLKISLYTSDDAVNALLSKEFQKAVDNDIDIKIYSEYEGPLPLPSNTMCSMLGNLIDNAFEANLKCEDDKKFIDVKILDKMDMMVINIENSYAGKIIAKDGIYKTTKRDRGHGIGLKQIEKVVKKADGFYNIKTDNISKTFSVTVFLPKTPAEGRVLNA